MVGPGHWMKALYWLAVGRYEVLVLFYFILIFDSPSTGNATSGKPVSLTSTIKWHELLEMPWETCCFLMCITRAPGSQGTNSGRLSLAGNS